MKINLKDEKVKKKIGKSVESVVIGAIVITTILCMVIVYMYQSTKSWKHSKLNTSYADAPAEFVSNQISEDIVGDIEKLTDVQHELDKIAETGDITSKSQKIYDKAEETLKKLSITSGDSFENVKRLKLYIDISNFIQSAYDNPDSEKLQSLVGTQSREVLDHDRDIDKKFMKKLDTIVEDYVQLNDFLNNTLTKIGKVEDNNLVIFNYITNIGEVETGLNSLSKFPKINELSKLIHKDISRVFTNNRELKEQLDWLQAKAKLDRLNGEYQKLSEIKTLRDAKRLGYTLNQQYSRDGYELSDDSEVSSFYYQGRFVDKSNYALKGLKLTVTIDPKWDKSTKVVEKEPSFEEKLEQSTDSVDQDKDKDKNRTEIPPKEDKPEKDNQRNTNQQNNSNATTTTRR